MDMSKFTDLHVKLKNSLFCGFKGWLLFHLSAITLLELSLYNMCYGKHMSDLQRTIIKDSTKNTQYQIKNHIIPFLEVMIVMPAVFLVIHYSGRNIFGGQFTPLETYLLCLAVCMGIMIMICMTLRILGIRKDCCKTIGHPIYRNASVANNDYINFIIPTSQEPTAYTTEYNNTTALPIIKTLLLSILMSPLTGIKAVIELTLFTIGILELPFNLILDISISLYHILNGSQSSLKFTHSTEHLQHMSSFLYAGARDLLVACSLGILNAKIIKHDKTSSRSPISYLDEMLVDCTTSKNTETETTTTHCHMGCSRM
ncbi:MULTISPECIES: hypothetical protein [Ehrlichia]|uniref:Uncharacterized protein n=1 Tax=Ehrlichia cf. muris str. EmCRT TaxID=1359167 RepID=A0A0F3NCK2_9RICK|nr:MULTISPECIES: hypothetical protein [Ehrlichia]KJV65481.1 hypothetical protein EMUCRT_0425 [Ehrlichia cf. muris str. EmCRT]OUC04454.1 hypothetical protein DB91_02230 [Ehrlichia sp. Wisconsin_h]